MDKTSNLDGVYFDRLHTLFERISDRVINDFEVRGHFPHELTWTANELWEETKSQLISNVSEEFHKLLDDFQVPNKFKKLEKLGCQYTDKIEPWKHTGIPGKDYAELTEKCANNYIPHYESLYLFQTQETNQLWKSCCELLSELDKLEKEIKKQLTTSENS